MNVKLRKLSKLGGKMAWVSGCSKHFMEGGKTILGDTRKSGGGGSFLGWVTKNSFLRNTHFCRVKSLEKGGKTF